MRVLSLKFVAVWNDVCADSAFYTKRMKDWFWGLCCDFLSAFELESWLAG